MPRYRIIIKTREIGNWTVDVDATDVDEAIYVATDKYLDTPNRHLRVMRWDALPSARFQVVDRWHTGTLTAVAG